MSFGFANIRTVFRSRDYSIWTIGSAVSLVGMWAQRIGVGWLAWELTGSSFWVAAVAFADLFPVVFVGPLAGMIGDRTDRLRVIRGAQLLAVASSAGLLVMMLAGAQSIGLLMVLVLLHGLAVGLKQPARMAVLRSLVPQRSLPTAVALSAVVFNTARFVGPAIAGLVIVFGGIAGVFALGLAGALCLLVAIAMIDARNGQVPPRQTPRAGMAAEMAAGFRFAAAHGGVGPLLALQFAFGLSLRGYLELLPGYSAEMLGMGAEGLAVLTASVGAGAILAGIWMAHRGTSRGLTLIVFIGMLLAALSVAALAFAPGVALASPLVAANGFALTANAVATQTLIQRVTPEELLARVLAIHGVIFRAAPAVSAIMLGAAADRFGFGGPMMLAAVVATALVFVVFRRFASIRFSLEGPHKARNLEPAPQTGG